MKPKFRLKYWCNKTDRIAVVGCHTLDDAKILEARLHSSGKGHNFELEVRKGARMSTESKKP